MVGNTGKVVKFTDEQTYQLNEWQNRLKIIQDQLKVEEKSLEILKRDKKNIETNVTYLNNQAEVRGVEVRKLLEQKDELLSELQDLTKKNKGAQKEFTEQYSLLEKQKEEVKIREKEVSIAEKSLKSRMESLIEREKMTSGKELSVEQAQKAFLKAIESITWK